MTVLDGREGGGKGYLEYGSLDPKAPALVPLSCRAVRRHPFLKPRVVFGQIPIVEQFAGRGIQNWKEKNS